MRIGLISSDPFYLPGGVQEQVKGLYNFLKSKGYYVKVLAPRHKKIENYGEDFILFGRGIPFPLNASTGNVSFSFNTKKIQNILKKENFDILHFHNLGIFTPLQILNLSQSKNILTLHTLPDASSFYRFTSNVIKFLAKRSISKGFDSLIATSAPVREHTKGAYNGPTYIIPNGIDFNRFEFKEKINELLDGKVNILFVGRFDKRKGIKYLMTAFESLKKKHENVRLILVGNGPEKQKYEKRVKKRKIKDVVFTGQVDNSELPKYYASCDIFCSPAVYGESFGVVLLEAMASGKPVVGFANEGYKQVIKSDIARKFLVKPKATKKLTTALETLIEDEQLRKKLGKWGLKEVKKYSWENVGKEILEVYKKVLYE